MKLVIRIMVCLLCLEGFAYAADYSETNGWSIDSYIKAGRASYKEKEATVKSDFDAFYSEFLFKTTYQTENDIEIASDFSFGSTTTDTETWHVNGVKRQTNDLDFYRLNLKGTLGKVFYLDRVRILKVTPSLGYGFRFINFSRTNFNILNIITSRDVVTERYFIHHFDAGLRLDKEIDERFDISALASLGYIFYNKADNNALGQIEGDGGYLADGNINLIYSLDNSWKLILGGFVEFQKLKGGTKGNVIWPDNELRIFGGNIGAKYEF